MKGGLFTCLAEIMVSLEDSATTPAFGLYLSLSSFAAAAEAALAEEKIPATD
jgi:hypothetical protein